MQLAHRTIRRASAAACLPLLVCGAVLTACGAGGTPGSDHTVASTPLADVPLPTALPPSTYSPPPPSPTEAPTGSPSPPGAPDPNATPLPAYYPTPTPVPTPVPTPPPAVQDVVFRCTGNAPRGIDITYGPEGSNYGASRLPFSRTLDLDANAQYYNVTAQLQGAGTVSCSTNVNWADYSGSQQTVTQTGNASGGYNIASAEVCSDFSGGWQAC